MSPDQMRHGLMLVSRADELHKQLTTWVLTQRDSHTRGEEIQVGYRNGQGELARHYVPIPPSARSLVFALWRKSVAEQFNATVRELNQLGISHAHSLVEFNPGDGMPRLPGDRK